MYFFAVRTVPAAALCRGNGEEHALGTRVCTGVALVGELSHLFDSCHACWKAVTPVGKLSRKLESDLHATHANARPFERVSAPLGT
jgi:hypothetical protein